MYCGGQKALNKMNFGNFISLKNLEYVGTIGI